MRCLEFYIEFAGIWIKEPYTMIYVLNVILSDKFSVSSGIRQGWILSTILFIYFNHDVEWNIYTCSVMLEWLSC